MKNNPPQILAERNPVAARKIVALDHLDEALSKAREAGHTIVQCHGVFDLMHPGHIRHLAEAKQQGDVLVVTITSDRYVNKGPGRPVFTSMLRAETLASLASVDYVVINDKPHAIEAIEKIRPKVYVKGSEYTDQNDDLTGKIIGEKNTVEAVGGRIHFTHDITFSSSSLINQNLLSFPPETEAWLRDFRQSHTEKEVLGALDSVRDLNVLVLGEAIIDEYIFSTGLGKSAKDPILAFHYQTSEAFCGGSLAIANHLGEFCKNIDIVTLVGEFDRHEGMIHSTLHDNVTWHPVTHIGAPTLRKTRYVDTHTGSKIFELYHMDDDTLTEDVESELLAKIDSLVGDADIVIVPDYGHGMMTPTMIDLVCKKSKFLVVSTQTNAGNRGFNMVSKYPRADYVCVAGHEMELENRQYRGSQEEKLMAFTKKIDCPRFTVTIGSAGSLHYQEGGEILQAPALASKIVDRVGSGDAVLAITGVLVAVGIPWGIVSLVGNAAGAHMVSDLGNRISLSKASLSKQLVALMK